MKKTLRSFRWLIPVLALAVFLLTPLSSFAATKNATHPATHLSPACTGSVTATPGTQTIPVNVTGAIAVTWHCEAFSYVVTNVVWADGNVTSYTCWAGCNDSGSIAMQHAYSSKGTFYPYIYMGGNASGFTSVKIIVK